MFTFTVLTTLLLWISCDYSGRVKISVLVVLPGVTCRWNGSTFSPGIASFISGNKISRWCNRPGVWSHTTTGTHAAQVKWVH